MDLAELVEFVTPRTTPPTLIDASSGFAYVTEVPDDYIAPTFRVLRQSDDANIFLIMAPAATGKSALANAIAGRSGAPLWDIHSLQVGNSTFTGRAMDAFHGSGVRLLGLVPGDGVPVVVDALDEAQLRAGDTNFEAFCRDLIEKFSRNDAAPLVLLARSETATFIQILLEDLGRPYTYLQLDYFDQAGAELFIDKRLRARASKLGVRPFPEREQRRYKEFRDYLFDSITALIASGTPDPWSDLGVRAFLGYAPVLQALADFLDFDTTDLPRQPTFTPPAHGDVALAPWILLRSIVEHILDREQQKFVSAVKQSLDVADIYGWDAWDSIFSRSEQVERVLLWTENCQDDPSLRPPSLPEFLHGRYDEIVASHIPQHAFVSEAGLSGRAFANGVFDAYVTAKALSGQAGNSEHLVRARFSSPGVLATPMLARFIIADQAQPPIACEDVALLYHSIRESSDDLRDAFISVVVPREESTGQMMLVRRKLVISITVTPPSGGVTSLTGRLTNLGVLVPGLLQVGSGGDIHLGPSVFLAGDHLIMAGERVFVHENNIVLGADQIDSTPAHQSVNVDEGAALEVRFATQVGYPLSNYIQEEPIASTDLEEAELFFWRILRRFHGSQSGILMCGTFVIERIEVGRSGLGQRLYSYLGEVGLIRRSDIHIELDPVILSGLGLTFDHIRKRQTSPQVDDLLRKFVGSRD